jgi:N,N'-diacetyllegionaminate synthase
LRPKTKIIADISSNHMGNINIAKSMVDTAADLGVDFVKFQSWQARYLRKDYPDYDSVYKRHSATELSDRDHIELFNHCRMRGIGFLTTCFNIERADFLRSIGVRKIKVASPDCANIRLLKYLMERFDKLIISTGMSTQEEVLKSIETTRGHDVVYLHCTSLYPTPASAMNLKRMEWLERQNVRVGSSDHSLGIYAGMLAIARGADYLEKHFTLSRSLPGKDQGMSTEPSEFKQLVEFRNSAYEMDGEENPSLSHEEQRMRSLYIGKWGFSR